MEGVKFTLNRPTTLFPGENELVWYFADIVMEINRMQFVDIMI